MRGSKYQQLPARTTLQAEQAVLTRKLQGKPPASSAHMSGGVKRRTRRVVAVEKYRGPKISSWQRFNLIGDILAIYSSDDSTSGLLFPHSHIVDRHERCKTSDQEKGNSGGLCYYAFTMGLTSMSIDIEKIITTSMTVEHLPSAKQTEI